MIGRSIVLLATGVGTFGAAVVTIAQGVLDPTALTVERLVGGGVLMGAAILFVRWGRQSTADMRATMTTALEKTQQTLDQTLRILESERKAFLEERRMIKSERDHLSQQLIETQTQLITERNMRLSLEQAGLHERRHAADTREIPDDTTAPS